jgi:DNA-binding CsgD family transcriptional regulator
VISTGSLEPVDGGQVGSEPVTGWRVWRLANNRLYAIAKNVAWQPGENQAECLAWHKHDIPAPSCHCGFWALHNPVSAMQLAAQVDCGPRMRSGFTPLDTPRTMAVGLILGYGAIAVHGFEGYRSGLASVACIFSDAPKLPAPEHADLRRAAATKYGVPCITMEAAISIGFLEEMGVGSQAIEQLRAWIAAGRPLADAPRPQTSDIPIRGRGNQGEVIELTRRESQIARLVAQGLTNVEIARSIYLASRAVDFHLYRLFEKTGSRNRGGLAFWVTKHDG